MESDCLFQALCWFCTLAKGEMMESTKNDVPKKPMQSSKVCLEISGFHYIVTHKGYDGCSNPNRPPSPTQPDIVWRTSSRWMNVGSVVPQKWNDYNFFNMTRVDYQFMIWFMAEIFLNFPMRCFVFFSLSVFICMPLVLKCSEFLLWFLASLFLFRSFFSTGTWTLKPFP